MGDPAEVKRFCDHMASYFDIDFDDVPQYLGTIYRRDLGRWVLPARTYNLKLYQPERDYEFKDYPHLGLVARRETFIEYGEPQIASDIIPFEDELWAAIDYPFVKIVAAAIAEKQAATRKGITLNQYLLTDKDYLMTEEDKIRSGLFWHFTPDQTATIVLSLVGDEVKEQLPFRHMKPVPLPQQDAGFQPFSQAGIPQPQSDEGEEDEDYAYA
jgi:hypothetical protein